MANSADPDQLASEETNGSGSTLFPKVGYNWAQQDKRVNKTITRPRLTQTLSNIIISYIR